MKVGLIVSFGVIVALLMGSFGSDTNVPTTPVQAKAPDDLKKPEVLAPVVASTPVRWTATAPVNGVSVASLNNALAIYRDKGLSKTGAAYLIGNFAQESPSAFVDPCLRYGDGGRALGFGQWWPARRADMPCTVNEQLVWAIDVEMPRDARHNGYASLSDRLRTDNVQDITTGLKQWERYGIEGNRYVYGQQLLNQIK